MHDGLLDAAIESTYTIDMKAVQVMLDERLLEELDATDEARREGRSAVLRRALRSYLVRRRRATIAAAYAQAYQNEPGLGRDWDGWTEQGVWPDD